MDLTDDDIETAYYVNNRYVRPLIEAGQAGHALKQWYRKVALCWETSACGPEIHDSPAQFEVSYNATQTAVKMSVTARHVRRLAEKGRLSGAEKCGRDWQIPETAVNDYLEERRNGRARSRD